MQQLAVVTAARTRYRDQAHQPRGPVPALSVKLVVPILPSEPSLARRTQSFA